MRSGRRGRSDGHTATQKRGGAPVPPRQKISVSKEKQNSSLYTAQRPLFVSLLFFFIFLLKIKITIIINEHGKYRPRGGTVGISLSTVSASRWFITDVWTVACIRNSSEFVFIIIFLHFYKYFFIFSSTLTLVERKCTSASSPIRRLLCDYRRWFVGAKCLFRSSKAVLETLSSVTLECYTYDAMIYHRKS